MKNIKTYDTFINESLKSYDMRSAKKVIAAELERLVGKDFWITTDQDLSDRFGGGYDVDKMIIVELGTKTGNGKKIKSVFNDVLAVFDKVGWFPANITVSYGKWQAPKGKLGGGSGDKSMGFKNVKYVEFPSNTRTISFTLDPVYDDIASTKGGDYYHVTKMENMDRILTHGLLPKSHSKRSYYPQRIYLATDIKSAEIILPELAREDPGRYVMLQVHVPDNIPIYKDTRYKHGGVYVLNPIAPENISPVVQNIAA